MASGAGEGTLDLDMLRQGIEGHDTEAMLSLYADDAEISVVDQRHTPSHPHVLRNRDQIQAFLQGVFGRDMTHRVDHIVAGDGSVSFSERCEYPDGTRVLASAVLDIDAGHIIRQELVQAWDPGKPEPGYQDFTRPDEVRTFEKGRLELLRTPAGDVGRMVLSPGWRWSEHVRPLAGTDLCEAAHMGYQISGRLRIQLADGTTFDAEPGQVGSVPPGHDAWVVGDETAVLLDWAGATDYARR
jgi:quercetin dioxygenase-like cupin family protein